MNAIKKYETHASPRRSLRRSPGRAGFTLIEIMLVVVIIGILAAVVVPRLSGRVGQSQVSAAKSSIASVSLALDLYETDNGNFPASLQSLITKGSEQNWRGPYLKKGEIPIDPWGHEFVYALKENGYEVRSPGPNGVVGDTDDVTN